MQRPSPGSAERMRMEGYEPLEVVGSGSFGIIRKILVRKEIDYRRMSNGEKRQLVAEVNILRELRHPNIVRYFERFVDKESSLIFIVMEYCEGGDLAAIIRRCKKMGKRIAEDLVWVLFAQLVLALDACHQTSASASGGKKGVVILHRDIKPENVFLDNGDTVKLGDFGLSRVLDHPETGFARTYVGTPYYMSPEIVRESSYNTKSDLWALGCLVYELCSLRPPFQAQSQLELSDRIKEGYVSRLPGEYSDELNSVQERRPSTAELLQYPRIQMVLLKRENDRLQKELLQRDDSLKAREAALQSRAAELEKLHARLAQQDATLKCREVLMDKREAALLAREQGTVLSSTDDVATDATLASKSAMPPPPPKQKSVRTEPQSPRTVPPSPRPISVDSTPQGRRLQLYGSPMVLSTPFQNMREPADLNRDTSTDKTRRTASSENSPGRSPMAMTGSSLNGFASIESTPTRRTTAPSSTLGNTRMYRSPLGAVQSATGSPLLAKDLFRAQRFGFVDKENSSTTMPMAKMRPKDGNVVTTIDNDVDDATMEKLGAWLDSVHIRSATTTPNKR